MTRDSHVRGLAGAEDRSRLFRSSASFLRRASSASRAFLYISADSKHITTPFYIKWLGKPPLIHDLNSVGAKIVVRRLRITSGTSPIGLSGNMMTHLQARDGSVFDAMRGKC